MNYKLVLFWVLTGILLFVFLQTQYAYLFFFNEQSHLFLNDFDFLKEHLITPGGLSFWASDFFTQFYIFPYVGALLTTIIVTVTACIIGEIIRKTSGSSAWVIAGWIPAIAQVWVITDYNSSFAGVLSFLAMSQIIWLCLYIPSNRFRLLMESVLGVCLIWLAGSIGMLFAVWCLFFETIMQKEKKWMGFLPFIICFSLSYVLSYLLIINDFRFAFLPDLYYHTSLQPKPVIYFPWIAFLVLTSIALLIQTKKWKPIHQSTLHGCIFITLLLTGTWSYWGTRHFGEFKSLQFMKLDYLSRTSQWKEIETECKGKLNNFLYMNLLARALAEQGKLAEKMFNYDLKGPASLAVSWNKTEEISTLLSDICFTGGNITLSQRLAFEGNISSRGNYNARLLQRLVQTNLIFGEYAVAEKYICLLEKSWFYKDWAQEHRKFLYNEQRVKDDEVLGTKRMLLPAYNDSSKLKLTGEDLETIMTMPLLAHPEQARSAFEYLAGYYLLKKDLPKFLHMIDLYSTRLLPKLPTSYQEALIAAYESQPEALKKYHLDQQILNKYSAFRKAVLNNKHNSNLGRMLFRTYGQTYWYYLLFK